MSNLYILLDDTIRQNAIRAIEALDLSQPLRLEIKEHKRDRSLAQNRLAWKWYSERAEQQGTTPEYEHRICKLRYACPLLIVADEDFADLYRKAIAPLDYEKRISAMKFLPVTSLFKVADMAEYLTTVERESAMQGIRLSQPVDMYADAMGVRR